MTIELYTTGCPRCLILETKLDELDVPYEKITAMRSIVDKANELGISQVPFCLVDEKLFDFDSMMTWLESSENI